jgi:hypothetical protein
MAHPKTSLLLVLAYLSSTALGLADEVDEYVAREMQARRIPGLAFAVIEDGKVIMKRAYGPPTWRRIPPCVLTAYSSCPQLLNPSPQRPS